MNHIVKPGDTLSKIAKAAGISLEKLLEANPQFREDPDIIDPGDVVILPGEAPAPLPAPGTPSAFATKLASIAKARHDKFELVTEADPELCTEIKRWTIAIGGSFVSCTSDDHPWSAVFISSCVLEAGATKEEFKFSKAHSVFVHQAINNALKGRGVFHGLPIDQHAPNVGDIIHHNRGKTKFDFNHAKTHSQYKSHSVIVVFLGQDGLGRFALCIGGNEGDAIRRTKVRLTPQGFILQRARHPFISVIKTLK